MRTTESVTVPASPSAVYPYVSDLAQYPRWLGLVHEAEPESDAACPAWSVELRARVGPFARSKRLRMERAETVPDRMAVFERAEVDGREHARWSLRVDLEHTDDGATTVTMHLAYDGRLWTGGALARVLDDQIRRGREGLVALVESESAG
jgi:uncharacterized protein YndB with AHSA1/START domain